VKVADTPEVKVVVDAVTVVVVAVRVLVEVVGKALASS
jgi:hypothetical protein